MRFDLIETGARGKMRVILMIERGSKSMEHKMKRTIRMALVLGVMSALGLSACETGPEGVREAAVWPAPPEQPRVAYLKSLSNSAFASKSTALDAFLGEEDKIAALIKPYGVHVDKSGRVFVADTQLSSMVVFDEENKSFDIWGQGVMKRPIGISSHDDGRIFVTDNSLARVVIFDAEGNVAKTFGADSGFISPSGIAVSSELEKVFVLDTKRHDISVFDLEGNPIEFIGENGV